MLADSSPQSLNGAEPRADATVTLAHVTKAFRVLMRAPGRFAALRSMFHPCYMTKVALNDVSLQVRPGERVGLVGPNGAGKTTLYRLVAGIIHPTRGVISVFGREPTSHRSEIVQRIGLITTRSYDLQAELTPMDTLELLREVYRIPSRQFAKTVQELANRLGAEDLLHRQVRGMSSGERMKCNLLTGLVHSPDLILLDEPTIGLDYLTRKALVSSIKDFAARSGATLVVSSHYYEDIEELCERLVLLSGGSVIFDGSLSQLRKAMSVSVVRAIIVPTGSERSRTPAVTFEKTVPTGDVDKVLREVMTLGEVQDLTVSPMPLGEVVDKLAKEHLHAGNADDIESVSGARSL